MTMENYNELFNPQVEMGDTTGKTTEDYNPTADKGKGGVYQSIIRFIPWWQNPKNSLQEKWVCWLVDPVTNRGRFVDCPSSVGKPSLLQDMYWKLKKSESVQEQKKADVFSRRHSFSAVVQIIKDENNTALEGKLMLFKFGKKLWEKINSEMKPILGEPHNPFDLLNGKVFHLVITKVSGFNNYDQSKFLDKVIPLCIPAADGKLVPINAQTDKTTVYNFLKENSPELSKTAFKEWDQELYDYVNHVITATTGIANVSANYANVVNETKTSTTANVPQGPQGAGKSSSKPSNSGITSSNISMDDLNSGLSMNSFPDIDLPELPSLGGLPGNLDDALRGL